MPIFRPALNLLSVLESAGTRLMHALVCRWMDSGSCGGGVVRRVLHDASMSALFQQEEIGEAGKPVAGSSGEGYSAGRTGNESLSKPMRGYKIGLMSKFTSKGFIFLLQCVQDLYWLHVCQCAEGASPNS
jgi:hypothetical protein